MASDHSLAQSYDLCEEIARREAANFYPAFRVLPFAQRRAMCVLYAFMRHTDDLSDEPGPVHEKRLQLQDWRQKLHQALAGDFSNPIHPALHHMVAEFRVDPQHLEAVIDGVEMDLEPIDYATFGDLRSYCYRVASVVGLSCIRIWGTHDTGADAFAESAGIAFQLTNILRDLGEDYQRGRVYLPGEDLQRFGYDPTGLGVGRRDDAFRALMRFEIDRARSHYAEGWKLLPLLTPAGRAVFSVMTKTYSGLLDEMERRDFDVFSSRLRVSSWKKVWFALQALPARFGW